MGENQENRAFERTDTITLSTIFSFFKKKDVRGGSQLWEVTRKGTVNTGKAVMHIWVVVFSIDKNLHS